MKPESFQTSILTEVLPHLNLSPTLSQLANALKVKVHANPVILAAVFCPLLTSLAKNSDQLLQVLSGVPFAAVLAKTRR